MCHKTTCRKCGKPSWAGCGNHIEIALKGVPKSQRCQGHENDPKEPGFFGKMFGKKQFKIAAGIFKFALKYIQRRERNFLR